MTAEAIRRTVPPSSATPIPGSPRLVFSALAGPVSWSLQELAGWLLGSRTCEPVAPDTVRIASVVVTLAALVIAGAGASLGRSAWRGAVARHDELLRAGQEWIEFAALAGLLVSSAFVVAIVWAGFASIWLTRCGAMR